VDHPDQSLVAGGVVAADQSAALYSFASVGRSEVVSVGRLRFPGLDPTRRYRVTPLMLESAPSGLRPPLWWGVTVADKNEARAAGTTITSLVDGGVPEIELPGAALSNLGLAPAQIDPEHALLYYVEATA
jgi:alpha-galactosidase